MFRTVPRMAGYVSVPHFSNLLVQLQLLLDDRSFGGVILQLLPDTMPLRPTALVSPY